MSGTHENSALSDAFIHEQEIADEAEAIRGDTVELTPELFLKLWPLLKRPIPSAFIETIGVVKGKPYESTGIKSVQVSIDRMNNVLTPLWWWDVPEYEDDGKLATVTVYVGNRGIGDEPDHVMASGTSRGGVAQGSSTGNIYKGSYTNAAKLAFARLGVGHEIYLGAADFDPDTNKDVADQQQEGAGAPAQAAGIGKDVAKKLVDRAWAIPAAKENLRLAASHAAGGNDVGDCDTKAKAVTALTKLGFDQAEKLSGWIEKKATEGEVDGG